MKGTLIALAAIPISALLWGLFTGRWTAESRRTRKLHEGARVNAIMRIPVPWVFILVYLAGVALQRVLPIAIPSPALAWVSRTTGFVLIVMGVAVAFSALGIFRKTKTTTVPHETPSTLVISGPYRFTRNPMYLALCLLQVALGFFLNDLITLLFVVPLAVIFHYGAILREERYLTGKFGEPYLELKREVRRWI